MKRTIKSVVAALIAAMILSMMPLSVFAASDVEINKTNFGSESFAAYLKTVEKTTTGCNGDGKFSSAELKLVTSLKPDSSVTTIAGVKVFGKLKTLDVSSCTNLTSLDVNDTVTLSTLKLGSISNLEYLYAKNTAISSVDVTKCTKLKRLYLSGDPITSINITKNKSLGELLLDGTSITSIDVSTCPNLYNLDISNTGNAIGTLDISNNYLLMRTAVGGEEYIYGDVIKYARYPDGLKRFLYVDKDTKVFCVIDENTFPDKIFRDYVKEFDSDNDGLFTLEELRPVENFRIDGKNTLSSLKGIEMFCNLDSLVTNDTALTTIDFKNNSNLRYLRMIGDDSLTNIDFSKTPNLDILHLELSYSFELDLSKLDNIGSVILSGIDAQEIDLSNHAKLRLLTLVGMNTESVNLNNCESLEDVCLVSSKVSDLKLENDTKLQKVELAGSNIIELDLTTNPNVSYVNVSENCNFKKMTVSEENQLEILKCNSCNLSELEIGNMNLKELYCNYNNLSSLDLSKQSNLKKLECDNNSITSLDLSGTQLETLIDFFDAEYGVFCGISSSFYFLFRCDDTVAIKGVNCEVPTPAVTTTPSVTPTVTPSTTPTVTPTATPATTSTPSKTPTSTPTSAPTSTPTSAPVATSVPAGNPTVAPTKVPSATSVPGATAAPKPTTAPGAKPTSAPAKPTSSPSGSGSAPADNGVGGFIDRLYTVALGRDFDEGGKNYWTNEIKVNGQTGADIARQFLYSEEFLGKNMSQDDFLTVLYRTFFDREPDEGGLKYWKDQMSAGQTKEWVIAGFINSEEWANICLSFGIRSGSSVAPTITIVPNENVIGFATRLYTTCLKREYDPEGLDFWAKELANLRRTGSEAAKGFFFSDEINKSGISDSEFLTRLYKTLMNREPEKDGFNYWLGQMKSGAMSRENVFDGFAASEEWVGICADYGILR